MGLGGLYEIVEGIVNHHEGAFCSFGLTLSRLGLNCPSNSFRLLFTPSHDKNPILSKLALSSLLYRTYRKTFQITILPAQLLNLGTLLTYTSIVGML
jgi:hypothetical protein